MPGRTGQSASTSCRSIPCIARPCPSPAGLAAVLSSCPAPGAQAAVSAKDLRRRATSSRRSRSWRTLSSRSFTTNDRTRQPGATCDTSKIVTVKSAVASIRGVSSRPGQSYVQSRRASPRSVQRPRSRRTSRRTRRTPRTAPPSPSPPRAARSRPRWSRRPSSASRPVMLQQETADRGRRLLLEHRVHRRRQARRGRRGHRRRGRSPRPAINEAREGRRQEDEVTPHAR